MTENRDLNTENSKSNTQIFAREPEIQILLFALEYRPFVWLIPDMTFDDSPCLWNSLRVGKYFANKSEICINHSRFLIEGLNSYCFDRDMQVPIQTLTIYLLFLEQKTLVFAPRIVSK